MVPLPQLVQPVFHQRLQPGLFPRSGWSHQKGGGAFENAAVFCSRSGFALLYFPLLHYPQQFQCYHDCYYLPAAGHLAGYLPRRHVFCAAARRVCLCDDALAAPHPRLQKMAGRKLHFYPDYCSGFDSDFGSGGDGDYFADRNARCAAYPDADHQSDVQTATGWYLPQPEW